MKTAACRTQRRRKTRALLAIALVLPALLGGCPEFRNSLLDSAQTATESVLVGDVEGPEAVDVAARGFVLAVVELVFDSLRVDLRR